MRLRVALIFALALVSTRAHADDAQRAVFDPMSAVTWMPTLTAGMGTPFVVYYASAANGGHGSLLGTLTFGLSGAVGFGAIAMRVVDEEALAHHILPLHLGLTAVTGLCSLLGYELFPGPANGEVAVVQPDIGISPDGTLRIGAIGTF